MYLKRKTISANEISELLASRSLHSPQHLKTPPLEDWGEKSFLLSLLQFPSLPCFLEKNQQNKTNFKINKIKQICVSVSQVLCWRELPMITQQWRINSQHWRYSADSEANYQTAKFLFVERFAVDRHTLTLQKVILFPLWQPP